MVLALAALCAGAIGSQALAGKKKKTTVVVNSGPVLNGKQKVKVSGALNTTTACLAARSMRLFLTDASGHDPGHDRLGDQPQRRHLEAEREALEPADGGPAPSGQGQEADRRQVRLQGGPLEADRDQAERAALGDWPAASDSGNNPASPVGIHHATRRRRLGTA